MCLQIYLAADVPIAANHGAAISAALVDPQVNPVGRWLSSSHVYRLQGRQESGCGFPYVVAEEFIEYFEGMFEDWGERDEEVENARGLLGLSAISLETAAAVEIYPVWDGDESLPPKGSVEKSLSELVPEQLVLTERFVLRLARANF
ncbi:MAG TPA: hypothetical protein VF179_26980 [Thermoanaerobaculia bacterium]|nr:hypothetical protein [Thermoanaerobaculia bacterium]